MITPKYPKIVVKLNLKGPEGNVFVIIARVQEALQKAKVDEQEIHVFVKNTWMNGSYDELLDYVRSMVTLKV